MEILLIIAGVVASAVLILVGRDAGKRSNRRPTSPKYNRSKPSRRLERPARGPRSERSAFDAERSSKLDRPEVLTGKAYVVDGDTVRIDKTQIRLFGIDAPEMDHPYGQKAKWALVSLCKGQVITAHITDMDTHGRTVAKCLLPDGRDLSAEMVKNGLAIDWPKYSGGVYTHLEVDGIRKKLWLADARQKGRMHIWEAFDARKHGGSES